MTNFLKYGCSLLFMGLLTILIIILNTKQEHQYSFHKGIKLDQQQWIHQMISKFKCPAFFANNYTDSDYNVASNWSFSNELFFDKIDSQTDRCKAIKKTFDFNENALSVEEKEFPLAYGMVVYKDEAQVYLTLSAFYHPQNIYCIAIDGKSNMKFKQRIYELGSCFNNVDIIEHEPIEWCKASVLSAQYTCFRHLVMQPHSWQYYQYITGFDLPIKTNLEMVRIFKNLNGAIVTEVITGGNITLENKQHKDCPVKVWKSSMAAVISRNAANSLFLDYANHIILNKVIKHLITDEFIYATCNDELLWSTIFGNKQELKVEGAFDSRELIKANISKWKMQNDTPTTEEDPYIMFDQTISRYQIWIGSEKCKGRMVYGSCAFGIRDLSVMMRRHELLAHKFRMNIEPMAYFCLWEKMKEKARDTTPSKFKGTYYKLLPQVRLHNGESLKEALKIPQI